MAGRKMINYKSQHGTQVPRASAALNPTWLRNPDQKL